RWESVLSPGERPAESPSAPPPPAHPAGSGSCLPSPLARAAGMPSTAIRPRRSPPGRKNGIKNTILTINNIQSGKKVQHGSRSGILSKEGETDGSGKDTAKRRRLTIERSFWATENRFQEKRRFL